MRCDVWILEWRDQSGDPAFTCKEVAFSPERAVERIRVFLDGETGRFFGASGTAMLSAAWS
jgi:hypothetical protein